ncbi:MAG: pilus assembly protein [Oxalobacteraceae bacterium]|nr:MAG: pilus assembly protein [Oxalobacteraceae bacterium]
MENGVLTTIVRRFCGNQRGVAAIEFAILAIPLLVVIMSGIEFGFMMLTKARLGGTLQQAARMATTGDDETNGPNGENIDAMVKADLKVTKDTTVNVSRSYYDSFDQVRKAEDKNSAGTTPPYCWTDINANQIWDKDPSRDGIGGANDIVNYKITVRYPALFPLVTNTVTGNPTVEISGQAAVQNEPFEGGKDVQPKYCCISAAAGNPVTCVDP